MSQPRMYRFKTEHIERPGEISMISIPASFANNVLSFEDAVEAAFAMAHMGQGDLDPNGFFITAFRIEGARR